MSEELVACAAGSPVTRIDKGTLQCKQYFFKKKERVLCRINKLLRKSQLNQKNSSFLCKDKLRSKSLKTKTLKRKILWTKFSEGANEQD